MLWLINHVTIITVFSAVFGLFANVEQVIIDTDQIQNEAKK